MTHRRYSCLMERLVYNSVLSRDYMYNDSLCWIWIAAVRQHKGGEYGVITKRINGVTKSFSAHRIAVEESGRKLKKGQVVSHLCNNSRCVNPEHLVATSQSANVKYQYKCKRRKCPTDV